MADGARDNVGARNGALVELPGDRFIDVFNLKPGDLEIADIALALSRRNRFDGFTVRPYSVAEHSVYVARLVAMRLANQMSCRNYWGVLKLPTARRIIRQALLHDADETVLPDMCYTVKYQPEMTFYRDAATSVWAAVAQDFNVDVEMHEYVHEADKRMATTEKLYLKGAHMPPHWLEYAAMYPPYVGAWDIIDRYEVSPGLARRRFLDFYDQVKEN